VLLVCPLQETSSSHTYQIFSYNILQKHPAQLAKVRAELDSVFGSNRSAGPQLASNPYLVNQLEYTLACIKEILRLWPPASGVRIGRKGFFITDPTSGEEFNTDGLLIWTVSMAMHRSAAIWGPDVDTFKPERFLSENMDELPPDGYRPFEKGPRNCIGQELALIEMKVVLAMTLREFEVKEAYEDLEELMGDGSLWARDGSFRKGEMVVYGERMHQILLAAAKPSEGMPCRVRRREL
jgi:cytochrome P450